MVLYKSVYAACLRQRHEACQSVGVPRPVVCVCVWGAGGGGGGGAA